MFICCKAMKISAVIEKNKNNYYQISSDDELFNCCFGGYGYSVAEAKDDFNKCIQEAIEMAKENGHTVPDYDEIKVEYKYDIQSFFNYFDWINISMFAKKAGINESKMRQYKSGLAYASEKTTTKILKTIQTIGAELQSAQL